MHRAEVSRSVVAQPPASDLCDEVTRMVATFS